MAHATQLIEEESNALAKISRMYGKVLGAFNIVSGFFVFFLMAMVTLDVSGRYLLSRPLPGTMELGEAFMVVIVFFALANTEYQKEHIRVDVITMHVPALATRFLDILAYVIGIFIYFMIMRESFNHAMMSMNIKEFSPGLLTFPLYPVKFLVPLGSLILVLQFCLRLVMTVTGLVKEAK